MRPCSPHFVTYFTLDRNQVEAVAVVVVVCKTIIKKYRQNFLKVGFEKTKMVCSVVSPQLF